MLIKVARNSLAYNGFSVGGKIIDIVDILNYNNVNFPLKRVNPHASRSLSNPRLVASAGPAVGFVQRPVS
jgi:hypothetical protein